MHIYSETPNYENEHMFVDIKINKFPTIPSLHKYPATPEQIKFNSGVEKIFGTIVVFSVENKLYKFGLNETELVYETLPGAEEDIKKLIIQIEGDISRAEYQTDADTQKITLLNNLREFVIGELNKQFPELESDFQPVLSFDHLGTYRQSIQRAPEAEGRRDPNTGITI